MRLTIVAALLVGACQTDSGPTLVDVDIQPGVIDYGQPVVITAVVSDPDGADDLVSGRLRHKGKTIRHFDGGGVPGTFIAEVDWEKAAELTGDFVLQGEVDFTIAFLDTAGNEKEKPVSVGVTCHGVFNGNAGYCDGECRFTDMDEEHCGACGNVCDADSSCIFGDCVGPPLIPEWTECLENTNNILCSLACSELGLSCAGGCDDSKPEVNVVTSDSLAECEGDPGTSQLYESCDPIGASDPWYRCCCE